MRICVMILLSFLLSGCVTLEEDYTSPVIEITGMNRRFISLRLVQKGMSRNEVSSVLGKQVLIGYELTDPESELYEPVTVDNPYRTETIEKSGEVFTVDYYLAGVRSAEGRITDDELVPLIFRADQLIGTGWEFLNAKIRN